jgi:hypothetical protein
VTDRPTVPLTREEYLAETPPFHADQSGGAVVRLVYTDTAAMERLMKENAE